MPGRTKVFDAAVFEADRLRTAIHEQADRDGKRTQEEQRMCDLADRVYAYTERACEGARIVGRWMGGGMVVDDRGLMGQVRDIDAMINDLRPDNDPKPAAPPAVVRFTLHKKKAPVVAEAPRVSRHAK